MQLPCHKAGERKGRKALGIRRAHPEALGALAAPVTVVMVMVPMVTAPMVAALPTDEQQANHQQPHPVFHGRSEECHRLLSLWFSLRYAPRTMPRVA